MALKNKVAIVTGGNSGIGQAIVLELARQGASIVIDYVAHPEATTALEQQIAKLGDQSIGVDADVSKPTDLQKLIDAAVSRFGRVDIMPSFFFHLTNGDTFPDDRATPCTTLEEAKTFALGVAAELGRNRPSDEIEHLVVCVTDESGNEVFRTKVVNLQHPTTADEMLSAARFKAS